MRALLGRRVVAAAAAMVVAAVVAVVSQGVASAAVSVHCPPDDLQAAINSVPSGSTISVSGTCVGNFQIPGGKTLTLVGPATLDGGGTGPVLTVNGGANLTLKTLTVQNGHSPINGGGILADTASLTLVAVTVRANVSDNTGGGIAAKAGTLTIKGSTITENSGDEAGGLTVWANEVANVATSTISQNHATGSVGYGGGAEAESGASLTMGSVTMSQNTATDVGGAIAVFDTTTHLNVGGSQLFGNSARSGGGVYSEVTNATIGGTAIYGNIARQLGGGVYVNGGTTTLKGDSISGNTAGNGGGVFNSATVLIPGTSIGHNTPNDCVGC